MPSSASLHSKSYAQVSKTTSADGRPNKAHSFLVPCRSALSIAHLLGPPPNAKPTLRSVVVCTPKISNSAPMQNYIENQTKAEKKQWVYDVLNGRRETENLLLQTPDFVLLPDTEVPNTVDIVNLLAIFKDTSLKSIRSLTGQHLELLKQCRDMCTDFIVQNLGFERTQILAFFHYLPSVFQLHVHFCAPYGQYTTLDICKIHPLDTVISNLEIDPEYYQKVSLTTVVIGRGELNSIYTQTATDTGLQT